MRALRIIAIGIGALIALVVLLLVAVALFVNPNDFKGRIAQQFRQATGRELTLAGDIKLSVFPWIALELGPATVGNLPGFGSEPFASVQHAALRVRLLPLLHHELQIGRLEIEGMDLRLRKNAQGQGNWQSAAVEQSVASTTAQPAPAGREAARSSHAGALDLAGLALKNSRLSFQDMVADHVNLQVGHLSVNAPVPVQLKLELVTSRESAPVSIGAKFDLTLDPEQGQYRIASLALDGSMSPKAGAAAIPWKFSVPDLRANLTAQTLSVPGFAAEVAAAHFTGKVQGEKIVDAPRVRGEFKLEPLSPRALSSALGVTLPETRDAKALTKLAADGEFSYGANSLRLGKLDVTLDDSQLRGNAAVTNLDTEATSFELALDRINLDRYLSPPQAAHKPAEKPSPSETGKSPPLNGTLTIGSLTVEGLVATQVLATVDARKGITHIAPAKAKFYGGEYSGDITLDQSGPVPFYKLDQTMTGVDIGPLLKDFAKSQRFSGRGTVTSSLRARGAGSDALLKSLDGHVAANLSNGAVEGIDLWFEINRAMALVQKQTLPAGSSSGRTKFDAFKASADIADGVATTKDLNISSQNLRVSGQGTANLVTEAINYAVKATLLKAPESAKAPAATLADVPVAITGTLSSPKVSPDLEAMGRALLQQQLGKQRQNIEQQLQNKLKDILH